MTPEQMRRDIREAIEANARNLNERPTVGARFRPDGTVRIQSLTPDGRWVRGEYKEYSSVKAAHHAATIAMKRAEHVAFLVATGWTRPDALREAVETIR